MNYLHHFFGIQLFKNLEIYPLCGNQLLIAFVECELPSSKIPEGVQFRRTDKDHVAFVAKYSYPALQRAKKLLNEKVREEGGFVR